MAIQMNVNNSIFKTKEILTANSGGEKGQKTLFAGNFCQKNTDPIAEKRREAQQKAMKIVGDAWNTDKAIDQSIEERQTHYNKMLTEKNEAQAQINEINDKIEALKKEYGVTGDMKFKDCPSEYKQRFCELNDQAGEFKSQINEADKMIRDDLADIRAISIERLKASPMEDAQKTVDSLEKTANEQILDIAMDEGQQHLEEEMETLEEEAEKKAEEKQNREEKLEQVKEKRAIQEALVQKTREAVEEAKAETHENESPEIPLEDLVKIARTNSETSKAQKSLKEIKNSMNLLEADLTGIEVNEKV